MAKPTGKTVGDASMDQSFTLDGSAKDNDFFMYTLEEVSGDSGFYHIKNKGSGYYLRPSKEVTTLMEPVL